MDEDDDDNEDDDLFLSSHGVTACSDAPTLVLSAVVSEKHEASAITVTDAAAVVTVCFEVVPSMQMRLQYVSSSESSNLLQSLLTAVICFNDVDELSAFSDSVPTAEMFTFIHLHITLFQHQD